VWKLRVRYNSLEIKVYGRLKSFNILFRLFLLKGWFLDAVGNSGHIEFRIVGWFTDDVAEGFLQENVMEKSN
jgi:hypothetical protein